MAIASNNPISRRACLPLVAAAALAPALLLPAAARAQATTWQMYRREDLGFEVEMPGTPVIREEGDSDWKAIDAEVTLADALYGANFQEFRKGTSIKQELAAQRLVARHLGGRITRETAFTIGGIPGQELTIESEAINFMMRIVVVSNRRIMLSVVGNRGITTNASVRRFLDSLKLLPAAR